MTATAAEFPPCSAGRMDAASQDGLDGGLRSCRWTQRTRWLQRRPMDDAATQRLLARERRRAERQRLLASGPPSPCVSICRLDDRTGLCVGCFRNIDEIRDWMILPPDERQAVLRQIDERRAAAAASGEVRS